MSCFDIDFLSGNTNKNETNHFHIYIVGNSNLGIGPKGMIETGKMSIKEYGVLLHEYIHYIQHLLTLFGLNRCKMYNAIFRKHIEYMIHEDVINLPIKLTESDEGIQKYINFSKNILGTKHYHEHQIDEVEVYDIEIEKAKTANQSVKIGIYDFENNEAIDNEIEFGYWGIIESMAHMIQSIVDPDVDNRHDVVPYRIVEYVCRNKYPSIANDKKMMISLCMCSLMFNNPGHAFFDMAQFALDNKIESGIDLYSHVMTDFTIHYKNQMMSLKDAISVFLKELVENIECVIGLKLDYLNRVVNSCLVEANSAQNRLIDLLYNERVDMSSDAISFLGDYYGYPIIQADNVICMPNNSTNGIQPYRETAGILGFEILYKRVTSAQTSKCPWFNVCSLGQNTEIEEKSSEINQISYECVCNQWDKKGKCFMTQILKFYRLDKKKFIQSQFSTIQNIM